MTIKPLNDRLVVVRREAEKKTAGGIYLPDTAQKDSLEGEVLATGPGKLLDDGRRVCGGLKKGDRILFGRYAGTEVKVNGDEYLLMREEDVLGVLS
ncbi:MAG: co-chaperone GroES [Planctomycetes bacterium]|nr:co-chaperone GroES [Planctomycetota bacterium]